MTNYPQKYGNSNHLLDLAERAKVRSDPTFHKLYLASEINRSQHLSSVLTKLLKQKAAQEDILQNPFDHIPQQVAELINAPIPKILVGVDKLSQVPFFYPMDKFCEHALILGQPGTGKTELCLGMLPQFKKQGINLLVIDKDKIDYRVLKKMFPDLIVLNAVKDFYFNTLQVPPGVNPKQWHTKWVEIFTKSNDLLKGSMRILLGVLEELGELFSRRDDDPTIIDTYNKVESLNFGGKKYRSAGIQDSILSSLYATIKQIGEPCTYSKGIPIDWIANHSVVIEFRGLSDYIARFMVSCLLYGILYYRIANNQRGSVLRNVCCIDEAHWLMPPGLSDNKKEFSPIASLLAQSRALGLSLIIGSQSAMLEQATFDDTSMKICFRLGSGHSILEAQKALGLTQEQAAHIPRLGLGEAIVRIPEHNCFGIKTLKTNFG